MTERKWNWQQPDWPHFSYENEPLLPLESAYLKQSALSLGMMQAFSGEERENCLVELLCTEVLETSEIEGEILNRESVRSSIAMEFGLGERGAPGRVPPEERGIARMMKRLYAEYSQPLCHEMLLNWHEHLMQGRYAVSAGEYRTHKEEMQIISGRFDKPKIHFVAPPSKDVPAEMEQFIRWFNRTAPGSETPLPPLTRAGIAHLYFLSIHPFEDGNGRISRALVVKILSQEMAAPVVTALSATINAAKKEYYNSLSVQNRGNEISLYLKYFAQLILEAQNQAVDVLQFIIAKTRFFDHFGNRLNPRQEKVISRIFREGPGGFAGGLSTGNYISITRASRATATRDLKELAAMEALTRTGQLKSTRYHLHLKPFQVTEFL